MPAEVLLKVIKEAMKPEAIKEVVKRLESSGSIAFNSLEVQIEKVRSMPLDVLKSVNSELPLIKNMENEDTESKGLKDAEKKKIKEETGWSDEIIDAICSWKQYEIYKNADLHEGDVNGITCLLKNIDLSYIDMKTGKTNRELMELGRSPIDPKTGEKIELHHMGQKSDGPFVELAENSEHGDGNHSILHLSGGESWRNDLELKNLYQCERRDHWKARALEGV